MGGKPHLTTTNFHVFPGLEYQESSYKEESGVPEGTCKIQCAKDPKCGAFSYNEEKRICRRAGQGVHYDRLFSYYEKPSDRSKIQDHQLTSTDFDERARLLKSQKKNAQRAAAAAIIKDRVDREKIEETAGKEASNKNVKKEKQAKKTALDRARGRLLSEEEREKTTKDTLKVRASFDKGYFKALGASQEEAVKENKLKALEVKQKDVTSAKEKFHKSGEFKVKHAAHLKARKITAAEAQIQKAKEGLMKITNARRRKF